MRRKPEQACDEERSRVHTLPGGTRCSTVPGVSTEVGFLERRSASTLLVCATRPLSDIRGSDGALDVLANILVHVIAEQ